MMDPSIERIFHAAVRLHASERSAFLDRTCGSDATLRAEVEALLLADSEAGSFLDQPVGVGTHSLTNPRDLIARVADHVNQAVGEVDRIPGYRIVRFVASGGMGSVYEAEQEYPKRRVALKVIRPDRVTSESQRRFEFETQVLATLQHPVVAQVFDAGFVEGEADRRPYFAMEFVDGQPLTAYCEQHQLSVRDRLELVAAICDGVEHAHQKGVIHRDLKPDNILVNSDGRPKILDFGVGRAVGTDVHITTMETDIGRIVGTLPYMSPEQAAGDSQQLDTRTDVYSIGVMAYELLTGQRPYELRGLPLPQVLRTIQEAEPPRLSSTNRSLRGDLETIVSFSLSKEVEHRYGSAAALAEDIRRYLRREPISKQPLTAWYQFAKFTARNKSLVAGVASTFLVLIAGLTTSLLLLGRAQEAERQQGLAASAAQQRAAELESMTTFQSAMLSDIDAEEMGRQLRNDLLWRLQQALESGQDLDLTVASFEQALRAINATDAAAELIEAHWLAPAAAAIEQQYGDQPRVRAAIQQTLADTYRELGRFEQAQPLQDAALETRRRELGVAAPETLRSMNQASLLASDRGDLALAEQGYRTILQTLAMAGVKQDENELAVRSNLSAMLFSRGRTMEAERMQREVLQARQRLLGEEHPDTLESMNNLGFMVEKRGAFDEAEEYYVQALQGRRRVFGDHHPDTLISINNLASLREQQSRLEEAEQLYREVLAGRRSLFGAEHPATLNVQNNVGHVLTKQNRLAEALPLYEATLDARMRTLGDDHPHTLASRSNLGILLQDLGRYEQAEPILRAVAEGRTRVLGATHPETLASLSNLGVILDQRGRPDEAESLYRRTLEGLADVAPDHPIVLLVESNLATLLLDRNELDEAEPLLQRVLASRKESLGHDHPDTIRAVTNLAAVYQKQGRYERAEPHLRAALEGMERAFGAAHASTLNAQHNLGVVLYGLHRLDEAEAAWRQALEGRQRALGNAHPDTLASLSQLGVLHEAREQFSEAERFYLEALEGRRRVLGDAHPATINSMSDMASLRLAQGHVAEAERYYRDALAGNRQVWGDDHPDTLTSLNNLGLVLMKQRRLAEAEVVYNEVLSGLRRVAGEDHPFTLGAMINMSGLLQDQGKLAEAESVAREALRGFRRVRGEDHPHTLTALNGVGQLLVAQERFDEAEPYLVQTLDGYRRAHGDQHSNTCVALNNLGQLRRSQGRFTEAEDFHRQALAARTRLFGLEHADTLKSINNLARVLLDDSRPDEALPLLLEGLAAARNVWRTSRPGHLGCYLVKLGRARRDLEAFADAEAILLEAYDLLEQDADARAVWIRSALEALSELYKAWDQAEPNAFHAAEGERYRSLLEQQPP